MENQREWEIGTLLSESGVKVNRYTGRLEVTVGHVVKDSREAKRNTAYIAIPGILIDGHSFIEDVIKSGAMVILYQKGCQISFSDTVTMIEVDNTREAYALISARIFDNPSFDLQLVGVTGTNGKTTIATLLYDMVSGLGYKCGLISTISNRIADRTEPSTHTTPDAWHLQKLLRNMADAGCEYVFMEVSSHAIVQDRITGLKFRGGVFTNLTHDHLDYHKTFDAYLKAKKMFFDRLDRNAFALVNSDEKHSAIMVQNTKAAVSRYGLKNSAGYRGKIMENSIDGLLMKIDDEEVHLRLIGSFNAENVMAVYAAGRLLGFEKFDVLSSLSALRGVSGRFEKVEGKINMPIGIVDYAHTPDALEKVLMTLRSMVKESRKIITVVGCGGNRDKLKRPVMGKIAAALSDRVIFTSDNPRNEEPGVILEEMKADLSQEDMVKILSIENRKEAIRAACQFAGSGDVILVAGKGHENYQEIKGERYPFDDRQILRDELV